MKNDVGNIDTIVSAKFTGVTVCHSKKQHSVYEVQYTKAEESGIFTGYCAEYNYFTFYDVYTENCKDPVRVKCPESIMVEVSPDKSVGYRINEGAALAATLKPSLISRLRGRTNVSQQQEVTISFNAGNRLLNVSPFNDSSVRILDFLYSNSTGSKMQNAYAQGGGGFGVVDESNGWRRKGKRRWTLISRGG